MNRKISIYFDRYFNMLKPANLFGKFSLITASVLILMSFFTTSPLFAKGGDNISPFPKSDPLTLKQEAKAVAVDSAGNIIVAGYTNNGGMNNDFQITKFNSDGSGVAWRATFDKSGGDDQATAVAVDSSDNVIVTGNVWNVSNMDIQTIKYNGSTGAVLWQHTWSGAAGSADIATSIAVDASDNIYVAGYTANASGNDDYLVLKYPAAGSLPVWQEIFNSGYNSNDRIASITAGIDGIAVTGASSKGGIDFDILTRKYGFDKSLIWEQRRAGASNGDDRGVVAKTDSSGNVIVSGYLNNGINPDIITIKYSASGSGAALWEKVYNGGGSDEPKGLWIDDSGDIFVTGYTTTYAGNEDFYTVRYGAADGAKVWESIYDSGSGFTDIPVGIVLKNGANGGLFVTGYTITNINSNITTLKYSKATGALLWQNSFNGADNMDERSVGVGLTPAGDVCVAGWSNTLSTSYDFVVLKYDFGSVDPPTTLSATATSNSSIALSWVDNSANEEGFAIQRKLGEAGTYAQVATVGADVTLFSDAGLLPNSYYYYRVRATNSANGDSYYTNEAHALTKVVSYDAPSWIYTYNSADNLQDEATGVVVGADEHPVVTGFSNQAEDGVPGSFSFDYMTIKLDRSDKSIKWKALYDSGDGGTDLAAGITIDGNGDAVVTGTAYLSGGSDKSDDLYTIKYSSAGHTDPLTSPLKAWGAQYGTQAGIDQATAIQAAKDSSNNIVVIGHGININNDEDMFIIKYRPDGTTPWAPIVYDGPAHGNDYPSAVAFDKSGNIFITGSTENAAGNFDIFTAKYSGSTGTLIWSQIYAGAGNGDDHGLSLAVDSVGDIYITGSSVNAAGNEEWVTVKYAGADNSSNREIWRRVYNGSASPVNGNDRGIAVAIDPVDGAVVVAGTSYISLTDSDFHLIRYSAADGSVIWERNFDKPSTYDYVTAMAIDSSGYIYLAGNSRNGLDSDHAYDSSSDLLSLIYDFEGTFLGATQFNGALADEARAIAVNRLGEAFIAGITFNSSASDYLVVKNKNNYILVPAPFTLLPQADSGKINLSWGANTPGTQFQIERTLAPVLPASSWSPVTTASPGSTSFQDSALLPDTGYCYRIYAFSGSLNSRTITSCSTTTLVPSNLSLPTVDSTTQISLSWSQVAGNTGYKVERKTGAGGAWGEIAIRGADQNSYADSSLASGTTYFYRIATLSQAGSSLPSNEQNATTKPSVPLLDNPSNITNSQMLLSWSSVVGASSYTLQYKLSGGTYANVAACTGVTATSCVAAGLAQNSSYTFQVKASTSGGDSAWSNETGASALLAVPEINAIATPTTSTLTLVWEYPVVPGAGITAFVVDYKIGTGGVYSTSACPQDTAQFCNLSGLTPNRNYYFRVKARNAFGDSAWSNEQITQTAMPATTLSSATSSSQTQTLLTWTAVPETNVYRIQRAACKYSDSDPVTCRGNEVHPPASYEYESYGNYIDVLSPATSYSDSGLLAGTNYRYRVYAFAPGSWNVTVSNELNVWTALSPPVLSIIPASSTALNLSWGPSLSGETNYTVEVSTTGSGGAYSAVPAATAMPMNSVAFGHTGLSLATEYCYRVKAYSTEAFPPAPAYSNTVCKTTPPNEPALSAATNQYESSFTVLQDSSKYWSMPDYWINMPVVITSGGNTYTKLISGSASSAFYASPAFTTETISAGDSYVILQAVSGKATGNVSAKSLLDADKNWGMYEWNGYKIKIINSVNSANIGQVLDIVALGTVDAYTSTNFPVPIVAGDSYQMASYFGTTVGSGSSATSMVDTSNTWGTDWTQGYYLMMTSGRNNGHARKITGKTATTLTVNAFPFPVTQGDTYLIAPTARVAPGFGTAEAGSSATTLVDTAHVWRGVGVGFYLQMTSGSNKDKARIITVFDNSSAKTITVSPAFDSPILPGDSYMIVPAAQFGSYFGTAAGSPGNSSFQLVDSANSWQSDWTQGYFLMMTSGSNSGQMRTITAKTGTTLTVSPPFANNISSTDAYLIGQADATKGSGIITTTVAPGLPYRGTAKLTLTNGEAEFYSVAPGYANNYNYELLGLKDLTQLTGNFDAQFDYNVLSGLLPADSTLPYLYLSSTYASSRFDFQSPNGKTYNTYIQRGRIAMQDNGRSTAFSVNMDRLYDTRTMDNDLTPWKSWAVDQWKDYYLQMTSGPNNQLVRKVIANTANSITLESPFPNDPSARTGTAAASGNSNTKLVDSTVSNWTVNQWQNYYLFISSGANAGQTLKIVSSDASSVTVGGSGFTSSISAGDAYKIFNISGDAYRVGVIAGGAAINGGTQDGINSTNALLVDSSDNTGTTLPPKNWDINQWQNFYIYISSGPNIGQFRTITANTANSISVNPPFQYQLASGDSYSILDPRAAAQAVEAYWVSIYEPTTTVTEQLIIPAGDTSGRMRFSRSGDNLQFYTAMSGGAWQLRRELKLKSGNTFTPNLFWIYQLGRLPHAAGTVEQTKISNFQLITNPPAATNLSFSSFNPEVGHFFRRSDEIPVLTTNLFDISWNKIDTAALYEVERCLSADHQNPLSRTVGSCATFTQSQPLDGTTRIVNAAASAGLTAGYTYRFRVRAKYNATDYTAWSNEEWITVTPPAPTLNSPASGAVATSQLTVTWSNVVGDNGYKLFWKERSGALCTDDDWNGPIITTMNTVSYTHSGLSAGTFYCYKASAAGPVGPPQTADSAFSGIVSQTTKPVAPVLNSLTGVTVSQIDLTWTNVTGNTGYMIERKAAGDTLWTNIYNTSANLAGYSDTTVLPGTLYYYRLSANSGSGYSALSNEQSTTTAPAITVVTASVVSAGQINISWPLVQGATNYKIARKDGTGSYGQIDNQVIAFSQLYCGYVYPSVGCVSLTPVVNTFINVSLASNTTYCYTVTAWNSTGGDGAASVEKCVATLNIPAQNLVATALNSFKIRLDWTPMTCSPSCGAPESYEIERLVRDGNWVKIATVVAAQTTFTDRIAIDPLKQYRYRVRSLSGIGRSPYSEAVTYTPPYVAGDNVEP